MKQGVININGVIGSYVDETGQQIKGVELLDIIGQVRSQPDATSFLVKIKSPGGLVDVGDQIYDYLESIKAQGKAVDTITDGDVGSIATKIFLVGQNRTIVAGHEFFIHNPWTQPQAGDSNKIAMELQALKQSETKLRSFYQEKTGITDQGLAGLMDNETGMNSTQAVQLGFATKEVGGKKIKALALLKSNTMTTQSQTVGQKFAAKLGEAIDSILGVKPEIKAMLIQTEAGTNVNVSCEDPANLVGADATDEAGQPLPDGDVKLADGRVMKVAGGKVADVSAPQAAATTATPAPATPAPAQAAAPSPEMAALMDRIAALEKKNLALEQASAAQANIDDKINAAVTELKNSLVPGGRAPVKAINNNGGQGVQATLSPVQAKMKELSEKRK